VLLAAFVSTQPCHTGPFRHANCIRSCTVMTLPSFLAVRLGVECIICSFRQREESMVWYTAAMLSSETCDTVRRRTRRIKERNAVGSTPLELQLEQPPPRHRSQTPSPPSCAWPYPKWRRKNDDQCRHSCCCCCCCCCRTDVGDSDGETNDGG